MSSKNDSQPDIFSSESVEISKESENEEQVNLIINNSIRYKPVPAITL